MSLVEKGTVGYAEGLRANSIRDRLLRPANAVKDQGIDLRRSRKEPLAPPYTPPTRPRIFTPLPSAKPTPPTDTLSIAEIKQAVVSYFELTQAWLDSASRRTKVAYARHVAIYLVRSQTKKSWGEMKPHFGWRDHTTLLHGCKRIHRLLLSGDEVTAKQISDIVAVINANRSKLGLTPITQQYLEIKLEDKESIPRSEIRIVDEASPASMDGTAPEGFHDASGSIPHQDYSYPAAESP